MNEEQEDRALTPTNALYGTGLTGMFSDSMARRYIGLLAVSIGVTVSQMSYLRAGESLSRNLLQLLWGRLVDRYGKRVFIIVGRILNGVLIAALIFARTPAWLMPLAIGAAICWSLISPAWNSLMGDYTTYSTRGTMIGNINALSQAGSLGAMIVALIVSLNQVGETTPESFTLILAIAASMNIVSGVLSFFTEEKPPVPTERDLKFSAVFSDFRLRKYLLVNIVYGVSMAFAWPLFPFIIVDKLALKIWQIAAFSIFSSGTSMISQRFIGRLMDRIGRRPIVIFSRISLAISPLFYVVSTSWIHITIAEIILGVSMGAWMSSGPTYIIDLAPVELRATYLAANTAMFGVAAFFGNLIGGFVTDNFLALEGTMRGIHNGLIISAVLRFFTGLLFILIHETYSEKE